MKYRVFKFGGSSVKDAEGFRRVAAICKSFRDVPLLVVLSALGKTTNAMEGVVRLLFTKGEEAAHDALNDIITGHQTICDELGINRHLVTDIYNALKASFTGLLEMPYDMAYDQVVSHGELCSTTMLAKLLKKENSIVNWLDARSTVATNDIHRDATVDWDVTRNNISNNVIPQLGQCEIIVTQGFIGGYNGVTTTLGREGSDYTAAIFAYCMDAAEVTIWKDVPGILTGDPRDFENVVKIDRLSYREAIEMTYYGAKVIHPKTIKPLQNKGILLHVRSFLNPDEEGTAITQDVEVAYPPIVVVEKDQALLHISTRDFSFVAEHHMSVIFNMISDHRIKVNMMRNTAISFTVCVTDIIERVDQLIQALSDEFNVVVDREMELVTIRHYDHADVKSIIGSRPIVFEEKIKDTLQMVIRTGEGIKRK